MIDHLLGRPSSNWKRTQASRLLIRDTVQQSDGIARQVFFVLFFWLWQLRHKRRNGPVLLRKLGKPLCRCKASSGLIATNAIHISQIHSLATSHRDADLCLCAAQCSCHLWFRMLVQRATQGIADICATPAPEPLARMYTRNYYRATWLVTALVGRAPNMLPTFS